MRGRLQAFTAIKLNKIPGWQPSQVVQSGGFWQSCWGQSDSDGVGSVEPPDALSAGKDFIENKPFDRTFHDVYHTESSSAK